MIIDFHTHIFPDKIAEKTIAHLSEKGGIPPFSDGTVNGLLDKMEQAGVDLSVTLPVLTNPDKFESVNGFAAEVNRAFAKKGRRLLSFAGIHPKCDNIAEKMAWVADHGFLGVKLHPDYQETYIDDEGYAEILSAAKAHNLIVLTHAGVDCGFPGLPVRCTPERARRLIDRVPYGRLVLAHCGGLDLYDDVLELLCGRDVYLDTAYVLRFIGRDTFTEILRRHGADRMLFATDSPWSDVANDVRLLRAFELDKTVEDKIFFENARKLLGL
ncbi:MAG: amidohydrolase family protein [Clostridia bacterium]|nr:amidohydrolase family protein [Clostridia bacterium]